MLRGRKAFDSCSLRAHDGAIGSIKDIYFDDEHWSVRYFVVSTGSWLNDRKVLISPAAVRNVDWAQHEIVVNLSKDQVRNSPDYNTDKPVSRREEADLHRYYAWPYYWSAPMLVGGSSAVPTATALRVEPPREEPVVGEGVRDETPEGDPHLRSMSAVEGYHLDATDGTIGHVEDFLIDDSNWDIRYLVVDTRDWWPGKKVVVPKDRIRSVDWLSQTVTVDLTREMIKSGPEYAEPRLTSADYTDSIGAHYTRLRADPKTKY